jgi:hypothetical protein
LSISHWVEPDPGRWTVEKYPPLPPCHPTSTHARRPLPRSRSCRSACGGAAVLRPSDPRARRHRQSRRDRESFLPQHPLETLAPAPSWPIKKPLRAHHRTHTIPSNLPDILSSLRSLSFVVASTAGELLDAVGATAFGHRWKNGHREVEEKSRWNLFRPAPSSSSSPTSLAVAALFPAAAGESLDEPNGNDADAPLDSNPTAAYRFRLLK